MNDRAARGSNFATPEYLDTSADVQMEESGFSVSAGVANLQVLYRNGKIAFPVTLTILTSTGSHRGVHMSRLVRAASQHVANSVGSWLKRICREVNASQPGTEVTCRFEMPFADQFAKIVMRTTERGATTYQFSTTGITACPCSKKMIGIGHMQRAEITLVLRSSAEMDLSQTVARLGECFSAPPKEELKRLEEAKKILEAQDNPKFAEDLIRECVKRFPQAIYVCARCFESIHAHDAVATWSRKPGWMPVF